MNDVIKDLMNELGFQVSEITVKTDCGMLQFGIDSTNTSFIVKGEITDENKANLGEVLTAIRKVKKEQEKA